MRESSWSRIRKQNSVYKEFLEIVGNGKPTGNVWKETIVVSVTIWISVEKVHHQIRLRVLSCNRVSENASRTRSPIGKSPSGRIFRLPRKDDLKGTCTNSFCEKWHPPEYLFYKTESGSRFGEQCSYAHRQVDEQPRKRFKKDGDKGAAAMLKNHESYDGTVKPVVSRDTGHGRHGLVVCNSSNTRQLGCVFQDMEPPKTSSFLRKSSDTRKPIRRVKFTEATARHAYIWDQNLALGLICPGEPHQRSPNASKFEDRSQEVTEWQEQGAREATWKLAKNVLKLKDHQRAAFFSPSENRCLEFVVDSGASMRMISKKDLISAELETVTTSKSPTMVRTANGVMQTHEEATVYVQELDIFLTMKVLEDTPVVLSLCVYFRSQWIYKVADGESLPNHHCSIAIWFTSLFLCTKPWKFPQ